MLRKYSNYPSDDNFQPEYRKRKFRRIITFVIALLLVAMTVFAAFTFRTPLLSAYSRIRLEFQESLKKFTDQRDENQSIFQTIKDILTGSKTASPSADTAAPDASPGGFLYTVELTNGGRIEGRAVKIDKEIITVTDDKGVEIKVSRGEVSRITKIRL
jgi:hypothetical protein